MHRIARLVLVLSLIAASTRLSIAQNVYAALHGTVTDSSGSVIPGATVTALNTSTGISTTRTSDSNGYYIFPQLQVGGPYTITITSSGFTNFQQTGLTLNLNDNREVNGKLAVGATAQTVEVSASALQVETSVEYPAATGFCHCVNRIEGLPLEGRDAAGVQKLAPGVVESSDRFGSFSSNGNQTPQNSYLLNGADINDGPLQSEGIQVNPDAIAEINIVSSTLNPEFARNSGAVLNQVLKSGANSFHGSAFEFYRDTFLNNGSYFSPTRPDFHQNLYGGTLGGPVFKNKFFFFVGYQGLRNRTAATTTSTTLSSANFLGDFTADSNYFTGDPNAAGLTNNPLPFALGNCPAGLTWAACFSTGTVVIPQSQWDPIAAKVINTYVPQPNLGSNQYSFNAPNTEAGDQGVIRLDWTPTAKDAIWGSSVFESEPSTDALSFGGGSFPGFGMRSSRHWKIFSGAYTHTFSGTMLNEIRGGYYRFNYPTVIPNPIQSPADLGFAITPQLQQSGVPLMVVGSYFDVGNSNEGPQPRIDTNLSYADNFSWVRGSHSLKFGGLFEQFRVHNFYGANNNGIYNYNGGGFYSSGDPLIDFALGIPDTYAQTNGGFIDAVASERYAYAQDNWKASSDLTINFGIAWDAEEPNQNRQFGGLGVVWLPGLECNVERLPGRPSGTLLARRSRLQRSRRTHHPLQPLWTPSRLCMVAHIRPGEDHRI